MILFIQEFISLLNSYIQKTLTFHCLYNCKTLLSSWTLFHGSNFLCFHKLEIIRSNHWKIVWKGLFNYRLPYYLFIVIFIMIAFHLLLLSPTSCSLACPLQTSKWQTPQPLCLPCPWFAAVSWARTWPMLILARSGMAVISFFENDLTSLKLHFVG